MNDLIVESRVCVGLAEGLWALLLAVNLVLLNGILVMERDEEYSAAFDIG